MELTAKDVQVGDYVSTADYITTVSGITTAGKIHVAGVVMTFDSVTPIPLTAEILEKNGFEKMYDTSEYLAKKLGHERKETGFWCLELSEFDAVFYNPMNGFCELKFMEGMSTDLHISYVHELQHALRLVGVEKEITL